MEIIIFSAVVCPLINRHSYGDVILFHGHESVMLCQIILRSPLYETIVIAYVFIFVALA